MSQPEFNELGWRLFFKDRRTTLYYIRFKHNRNTYYKIGITTQEISKRFAGENIAYDVLFARSYKSGMTAYNKEQAIIKKNAKHRYFGPPLLRSGNSEVFTTNIMKGA